MKMARLADGRPLTFELTSRLLAPISTLATSLSRTTRPSDVLLTTISPNCSGVSSRWRVSIVRWKGWPSGTGGWPIWPVAKLRFCSRMARTTSPAARSREESFSGSTQTRMA